MVGIIATLPQSFAQEFASRVLESNGGLIMILIELVIWFVIILLSIMLVMAVRKIPVQYARRTASGGYEKNIFGARQFIPLKLNASGVMPIIFAQAIMFVPSAVASLSDSDWAQTIRTDRYRYTIYPGQGGQPFYSLLYYVFSSNYVAFKKNSCDFFSQSFCCTNFT